MLQLNMYVTVLLHFTEYKTQKKNKGFIVQFQNKSYLEAIQQTIVMMTTAITKDDHRISQTYCDD